MRWRMCCRLTNGSLPPTRFWSVWMRPRSGKRRKPACRSPSVLGKRRSTTLNMSATVPPIWHHKTHRIAGHLFIAVLTRYGVTLTRLRLKDRNIHDSWTMLRHKLVRWTRVTTCMKNTAGARIEVRIDARPNPEACAIAKAAGVPFKSNRQWRKHLKQTD